MKKLFVAALALAIILSSAVLCVSADSGTKPFGSWKDSGNYDTSWYNKNNKTHTLSNAADLAGLAVLVDGGNTFAGNTVNVALDKGLTQIDLSGHYWDSIGDNSAPFQGVFNGNGVTISGMCINNSDNSQQQAFFAVLSSGSSSNANPAIKNFSLINSSVTTALAQKPALVVGQLYTKMEGVTITVENIYAQGSVTASNASTNVIRAGGVCGLIQIDNAQAKAVFKNIVSDVDVTANTSKSSLAGGVLGGVNSNLGELHLESCVNYGTIQSANGQAGGIVGMGNGDAFHYYANCMNVGVVASSESAEGTLLGHIGKNISTHIVMNCLHYGATDIPVIGTNETSATIIAAENYYVNATANGNYYTAISADQVNAFSGILTQATELSGYAEVGETLEGLMAACKAVTKTHGLCAVQLPTEQTGDTFGIRFISKLGALDGYAQAGFEMTIGGVTKTMLTDRVYKEICATDQYGTITAYEADTLGAKYLYAAGVYNIPTSAENVVITVTPFTTASTAADSVRSYGDTYEITLSRGAFVGYQKQTPPLYTGGTLSGTNDAAYGQTLYYYTETTAAEYETYCKTLEAAGYGKHLSNSSAGNLYATYVKGDTVVHAYYTDYEKAVRLVTGSISQTGLTQNDVTTDPKVTDFSVIQMNLTYATAGSGGMGYVITLEDGRFVIVDGGNEVAEDAERLYKLLQKYNKRIDGIKIAGWILTHEHDDHYGLFKSFVTQYGGDVEIQNFYASIPSVSYRATSNNPSDFMWTQFDVLSALAGGIPVTVLHTGQKFMISNAEFEILYTTEDLYPKQLTAFNDASTVFRVCANGKSVLFLGDAAGDTSNVLCNMYGAYLKSDVVQVAHHGWNGATTEVYQNVDPEIAMWPNSQSEYNGCLSKTGNSFYQTDKDLVAAVGEENVYIADTYCYRFLFSTETITVEEIDVDAES